MPCVFSHQSTDHLPRGAAHARMGQGAVLLLAHLAANFFAHTPGRSVAFFAKKQNVLGAVILGIGNTIVALMGVSYFLKLCSAFPRHLLTVISCASIIVVLILGMQKRWKTRILSAVTTVLLTAGVIIWAVLNERVI